MLIEMGGDQIRDHAAPFQFFPQGDEMILDALQYGPNTVFVVPHKAQQQFHGAVSRPSTDPVHRRVQSVRAHGRRLDSVGKSQLQIIMAVDADLFTRPFNNLKIAAGIISNLLG